MGQQPQTPQRTRPYVLAAGDYELIDADPQGQTLAPGEYEDVPPEKQNTWSEGLGLNTPTDSRLVGFLKGSGGAAVDMAQGAASNIAGMLQTLGENEQRSIEEQAGVPQADRMGQLPSMIETPHTAAGVVGALLPIGPPAGAGAQAGVNAIPRVARAGAKFEQVMAAAKDIPIDTKEVGDAALRVFELSNSGGTLPKAVNDLLKRLTAPLSKKAAALGGEKPPLTYREARDFATNISRLSVDEMNKLTPVMKRQVAELAAQLNKANAEAAKAVGKGAEYKSAMREYANAMRMRDMIDTAIKHSKKAALGAAGLGGAAYWFNRE